MSFSAILLWMACLLWCAGLACADGRSSFAGEGRDAWETADGVSKIIPAVVGNDTVTYAAKPRVIEPMWPQAIAGRNARIRSYAEVIACFRITSGEPELEQAPWVGVIELRV